MLVSALRALRTRGEGRRPRHIHWLLASPLGLLSGRPWVADAPGQPTAGSFEDLSMLKQQAGCGPIIRRAEAVICVSQELTKAVERLGAKAVYIPNGTAVPERVGEEA